MARSGWLVSREETAARDVGVRGAGLEFDGVIQIGERLFAVAGGEIVLAAGAPGVGVGRVGRNRLGVGGDGLGALAGLVGFLAALVGGLRFLLVGFGVGAVDGNQHARHGERHGDMRQSET